MKRKLTGEESIFYRAPEANVSISARIVGEVNEIDLREALMKLLDLHPLLKSQVLVDENDDIWLETNECIKLDLKIFSRISDEQWKKIIQKEFDFPFDFEKGPLIRFILLKSTHISDLIIFCQHIICDGLSLANLVHEILTLMADSKYKYAAEHDICLPVPENIIFRKANKLGGLTKKIIMNYLNRKWKRTKIDFITDDFLQIHKAYMDKYSYKILAFELAEDDTLKLREVCRQNNVTVNSAISIAFLAARKDLMNYNNIIQGVAVNIRNRLKKPVGNSFGCFVSDVEFKYEYDKKIGFWNNARSYQKRLRTELDNYKDLQALTSISDINCRFMEALTFARHVNYNPSYFNDHQKLSKLADNKHIAARIYNEGLKQYPGLLITNIGALKYSDIYGNLKIEKIYFAPSSIPTQDGGLIIGAITINNKLSITLNVTIPNDKNDYLSFMNEIGNNAIHLLLDMIHNYKRT
ncbi:hypothetical protein CSC2_36960 [Clostridium zeae]|uniref:Condensation domain-containing protein n=1 Tax=Clostridium zeae TaxID=2759022 RepID=A0ABQ1EEH4_9CLOT|nr:condensation domain-containing protein [Clostridium zeae]GFZ33170.1 hypothetical protein CSC2_36960 [Clostridium zeae]